MRVLLIYPNSHLELIGWGDLGAIAEPLALEYLATVCRSQSHNVELLDLRFGPEKLTLALERFAPDVVAITGYSMHVLRMLDTCRRVKTQLPECKTVIGGHHATLMPDDFFDSCVDFVVSGEGTKPFGKILDGLADWRGRFGTIPGVWMRVEGHFTFGGPQAQLELDNLPLPDRSISTEYRSNYYIDWMRPIALIRTTVGCPYRCSFCSLWRVMDGHYYSRSILKVVDELKSIKEKYVFMVDDEPFVNGKRMADLADAIASAHIAKNYFAYCRVDSLLRQQDLIRKWVDVGLQRVFLGIEAISINELTEFSKRITIAQIEESLRFCKEIGLKVFAQFIVNPMYTKADFRRLVRFIEHNNVEYPSFTILTPIPGTPALADFNHVVDVQANGRPQWNHFDLQHLVVDSRLPKDEFMLEYRNLQQTFAHSVPAMIQ